MAGPAARRRLAPAVAGLFGVVLASVIAATGLAVALEPTDPALALRLRRDDAQAAAALATARLGEGRPAVARDIAREGLARAPLAVDAMTALGLAEARLSRTDAADRTLGLAAARSWWTSPAHDWLLRRRLAQGRYDEAYVHADGLLRRAVEGPGRDALIADLVRSSSQPGAADALALRLRTAPPWRALLLQALGRDAAADSGASVVFDRLARSPAPPIPPEYATYVNRLVGERRYAEALGAWRALARDPASGTPGAALAATSDGTPLAWSLPQASGGSARIEGGALVVDYDGYSLPDLPRRLLVLAPGRYSLAGAASGDADPRLAWQVRCDENGFVLGQVPVRPQMTLEFTVPPQGCAAQWIELTADPGGRPRAVSVVFRGLRLARLG